MSESSASPGPRLGAEAAGAVHHRQHRIRSQLESMFGRLLGIDERKIEAHTTFLEAGADSLLLLQAGQNIQAEFGIKVPFRQLLGEFSTPAALAAHLDREMPGEASLPVPDELPPPRTSPPMMPREEALDARSGNGGEELPGFDVDLEALLEHQLQIMNRQLELTSALLDVRGPRRPPPEGEGERAPATTAAPASKKPFEPAPYVPYKPARTESDGLSSRQRESLEDLIARLEKKAPKSKLRAQQYRPFLADNRSSTAFQLLFKELLFPIFSVRGSGSRVWDLDGNEYLDVTMGFGTLIFGHSPAFVLEALQQQSRQGLQIGCESPLAGPAAQLLCELTGNERAAFVNSGTEAVMTAIRLARTRTGRNKLAIFKGAYHGFHDEAMVTSGRDRGGRLHSMPLAPGVSAHVSDTVMVLDYASDESVEILRSAAHELAAVLVEPQQSRRPGAFETREFLHQLRRVTAEAGAALILDEVVTGFRLHPGGVKTLYQLDADLVTYGKTVGAGLPVGVVAGKAAYLDGLDGGMWSYGDASYPGAESTFLAGTYFKHPFTIPAIWAVLDHYRQSGPKLQEELTERTARQAETLNAWFERERLPVRVLHWGSVSTFAFSPEVKYPSVFYYDLLDRGLYVRDTRPWFFSTAHTDDDMEEITRAVRATLRWMRESDFLPAPAAVTSPTPTETPEVPEEPRSRRWQLLVLSAASSAALEAVTRRLAEYLEGHPEVNLADVACTCQTHPGAHRHRRGLICRETAAAAAALREGRGLIEGVAGPGERSVAFLFPGLGDHYPNMARELYDAEPVFRAEVERCCELLEPRLGMDLRQVLYPSSSAPAEGTRPAPAAGTSSPNLDLRRLLGRSKEGEDEELQETRLAQPAVFVVEYALAKLWMAWGVRPEAMLGYSLGEYTAACLAGVLSLEDALRVVAERARLIDQLPAGGMLAISLPEHDLLPMLGEELSLAASYTPEVGVVAGPLSAIAALERGCAAQELVYQRLKTTHAMHSAMMEPIAERLTEVLRGMTLKPPEIPYLSNVTGTWITAREAVDPAYWAHHLCRPVRFAEGLEELLGTQGTSSSARILLEVGPGQALSIAARQLSGDVRRVIASLREVHDRQSDEAFLLGAAGRLWLAGVAVDWTALHAPAERRRLTLPLDGSASGGSFH